jgi:sulfur carrier protein
VVTSTVRISLNGAPATLDTGITIGGVVDGLGKGRRGVAVAVNDEVVPRSRWDKTAVRDHDRVEILTASQGG